MALARIAKDGSENGSTLADKINAGFDEQESTDAQNVKKDGSVPFTGKQKGVDGVALDDLATLQNIKDSEQGADGQFVKKDGSTPIVGKQVGVLATALNQLTTLQKIINQQ